MHTMGYILLLDMMVTLLDKLYHPMILSNFVVTIMLSGDGAWSTNLFKLPPVCDL